MKRLDLSSKRFGKLLCLSPTISIKGKLHWLCQCDCCNKTQVSGVSLVKYNGTESCGCLKKTHFNNLTGKKFNNLTVLKHIGKNNYNNNIYECVCDCSKLMIVEGTDLNKSRIKSCGSCMRSKNSSNKLPYGEMLWNLVYNDYKIKAGQRGIFFNLTKEFFKIETQKNCNYCGSEPKNVRKNRSRWNPEHIIYNGLDRVDNDQGYVEFNVVPCCYICNQAKHKLTVEIFKDWVKRISMHMRVS